MYRLMCKKDPVSEMSLQTDLKKRGSGRAISALPYLHQNKVFIVHN